MRGRVPAEQAGEGAASPDRALPSPDPLRGPPSPAEGRGGSRCRIAQARTTRLLHVSAGLAHRSRRAQSRTHRSVRPFPPVHLILWRRSAAEASKEGSRSRKMADALLRGPRARAPRDEVAGGRGAGRMRYPDTPTRKYLVSLRFLPIALIRNALTTHLSPRIAASNAAACLTWRRIVLQDIIRNATG